MLAVRFHTVLLILHLTALAIGLGAAFLADWIAVTKLLFGRLSARSAAQLRDLSTAVSVGLAMLWMSGSLLVWDNFATTSATLGNEKLWAKLVIVVTLSLNAVVLHKVALPLVQARIGQTLFDRRQHRARMVCALLAAVSFTSWVFALYLGAARELNGTVAMIDVLTFYSEAVILVWLGGLLLCYASFREQPRPVGTPDVRTSISGP